MEAIPSIVCDTLYSMGLHDQTPAWKIMDSKGHITVVLAWDKEHSGLPALSGPGTNSGSMLQLTSERGGSGHGPSRQSSLCSTIASGGPRLLGVHARSFSQVNKVNVICNKIESCKLLLYLSSLNRRWSLYSRFKTSIFNVFYNLSALWLFCVFHPLLEP